MPPGQRGEEKRGITVNRVGDVGGARLLASDTRVALLLLNEARYRMVERLFAVPREEANIATVLALLILAEAVHERARRVLRTPAAPASGDVLLGAASVRESLRGVAGASSRDTPLFGTLLMVAILGGPARRAALKSVQGLRASSHRMNVGFHHRYGYLVDPGHLRRRRAQRRGEAATP